MGLFSGFVAMIDRRVNRRVLAEARDRQLRWLESAIRRERHQRYPRPIEASDCDHVVLLPIWESLSDMGVTERASAFTCDACRQRFSPAEAAALHADPEQAQA